MIVATIADYTGIAAYQRETFDPWRIVGFPIGAYRRVDLPASRRLSHYIELKRPPST
jgi:hypothetical protein